MPHGKFEIFYFFSRLTFVPEASDAQLDGQTFGGKK